MHIVVFYTASTLEQYEGAFHSPQTAWRFVIRAFSPGGQVISDLGSTGATLQLEVNICKNNTGNYHYIWHYFPLVMTASPARQYFLDSNCCGSLATCWLTKVYSIQYTVYRFKDGFLMLITTEVSGKHNAQEIMIRCPIGWLYVWLYVPGCRGLLDTSDNARGQLLSIGESLAIKDTNAEDTREESASCSILPDYLVS